MLSRLGGFFKVKGKIKPGQKPSGSSDVGPQTNVPPSIQPVPPSQDVELLLQTEHQQTTSSLPMAAAPPKQTIGALPEHDGSNSNAQTHECTATPPVSASTVSETDKSVTIVAQTVAPPSSSAQTADPPAQQLERETQNASPSLLSSASVIPIDLTSLWRDALNEYTKQTGTDLDAGPLTDRLNGCISVNDIMDILEEHTRAFAEFRKGGAKTQLLRALKPIATAVLALQPSETLGEGIAVVFQPAKAIVGAVIVLLKATKDVSSSYDSLVDLLNCISKFLDRLSIYAGKSLTILMQEILVKTLANVVSILALATREVNQGRLGKYVRTLLGDTHVEDALKQLTRLGSTETQMIGVESLRLTYSLSTTLNELMQGSKESTKEIQRALEALQLNMGQTLQELKYDSDVQKHRNWLTPPDPSINHNLALRSYSEGTSAWFIDGQVMGEWKTTSSLLWIHGKPGSGKTILCTAIIENIRRLCLIQEKSNLAYFYCNFQDAKKQNARGLLSHVLIHFSAASHACSQLLSGLWSSHSNGSHQPSEHDLRQCLKSVIALLADHSLYIVIDALDECPDSSIDSHSQRRDVLMLIREIVDWGFHNVHICVTSRPEQDIREAMEALSPRSISLHTESGQTDEISSYVHSVIESDRAFRRWKASDRELAIQRLGEKANGMFRWVFCQLEMLRGCHPATIRKVLDDLPKTLDETYRRVLQTLDTPGWEYTHRLFECLIVCARPLRVDELADVLAIDFDSGPIPQFVTDWRPSDPKSDILSFCSSMIVIDSETGTVQFAHFSVQEYFVSERLASDLEGNVKKFHIAEEHAHTTMAKACLGILLQLDNRAMSNYFATRHEPPVSPLSTYAARRWIGHAKYKNVQTDIQEVLECAFDPRKPHYEAWSCLHNSSLEEHHDWKRMPRQNPLYCAALHSFYKTAEYLLATCAHPLDRADGYYGTALQAACYGGHWEVARLLIEHGADVQTEGGHYGTALQAASQGGHLEVVRLLIEHGADVQTEGGYFGTALQAASHGGHMEIVRLLIEHGADVQTEGGLFRTALQAASDGGHPEIVRLLIERGANVNVEGGQFGPALHAASWRGHLKIVHLLIEHGADVKARDSDGRTCLQRAMDNPPRGNWDAWPMDPDAKLAVAAFLQELGADS